jgi:hypothetical protein
MKNDGNGTVCVCVCGGTGAVKEWNAFDFGMYPCVHRIYKLTVRGTRASR